MVRHSTSDWSSGTGSSVSYLQAAPQPAADPLLTKIMAASSSAESEQSLDRLVTEHALPVIDSVVRRRCQSWSDVASIGDDVRGEVVIHLLRRLRTISSDDAAPISSFRDYVATVTSRVIDDLMRRHFPRRTQLKSRLRYLLRHDQRFVWTTNGVETMCALANSAIAAGAQRHSTEVEVLAQQVIAVLTAHSPCELEDLVTAVATATGTIDRQRAGDDQLESIPAAAESPLARTEAIDILRHLWHEIVDLPPKQRAALLLNLRDSAGESPVTLLPLLGIASIGEIAAMVGLREDQFVSLSKKLPLPDVEIAAMLLMKRQQVINLRKSARERLRRRIARLQHSPER
jgi:RNA polymerase sigma factor (sigma-70 family)